MPTNCWTDCFSAVNLQKIEIRFFHTCPTLKVTIRRAENCNIYRSPHHSEKFQTMPLLYSITYNNSSIFPLVGRRLKKKQVVLTWKHLICGNMAMDSSDQVQLYSSSPQCTATNDNRLQVKIYNCDKIQSEIVK